MFFRVFRGQPRLSLDHPLGTLQVDECEESVAVKFAERDHVGKTYHQNLGSPSGALSPLFGFKVPLQSSQTPKQGAFIISYPKP